MFPKYWNTLVTKHTYANARPHPHPLYAITNRSKFLNPLPLVYVLIERPLEYNLL